MNKLILDNSALSLLHCKRKFQLTVLQGLAKSEEESKATGSAFHTLQEHLDKGASVDEACAATAAKHSDISIEVPLRAVTLYRAATKLPPALTIAGAPAIEHKFFFKYGDFLTPNSSSPIEVYLCGTIDRIYLDGDILVFLDYKASAAVQPAHQERIMDSYLMAFQLPFYIWAMYQSGTLPAELTEHIKTGRYRSELHFIFYNAEPPRIRKQRRSSFPYEFLFQEVPHIVNTKIRQAIEISSIPSAAPRDGMNVYNACSYCQFKPACMEVGTEKEIEYLSRFPVKHYDPMSFR